MSIKEDLFISEYFRCGFNGAEAARRVYNIGARGGRTDPKASTARTIATHVLARVSVQEKLRSRLKEADIGQDFVLGQLKCIAENTDNPRYSMQALDRLAHFLELDIGNH